MGVDRRDVMPWPMGSERPYGRGGIGVAGVGGEEGRRRVGALGVVEWRIPASVQVWLAACLARGGRGRGSRRPRSESPEWKGVSLALGRRGAHAQSKAQWIALLHDRLVAFVSPTRTRTSTSTRTSKRQLGLAVRQPKEARGVRAVRDRVEQGGQFRRRRREREAAVRVVVGSGSGGQLYAAF